MLKCQIFLPNTICIGEANLQLPAKFGIPPLPPLEASRRERRWVDAEEGGGWGDPGEKYGYKSKWGTGGGGGGGGGDA